MNENIEKWKLKQSWKTNWIVIYTSGQSQENPHTELNIYDETEVKIIAEFILQLNKWTVSMSTYFSFFATRHISVEPSAMRRICRGRNIEHKIVLC